MKRPSSLTRAVVLTVFTCGCTPPPAQPSSIRDSAKQDALFAKYAKEYSSLNIPDIGLSFVNNLKALGSIEELSRQEEILSGYQRQYKSIDTAGMPLCQKIDLAIAKHQIDYGLKRSRLGQKFLRHGGSAENAHQLSEVALSKQWYELFLEGWHATPLDPDELFAFGEQELKKAVVEFDMIQAEMGYAGNDPGFRSYLSLTSKKKASDRQTKTLFAIKQRIVRENMGKLFPNDISVPLAKIKASDRDASFPVPGYYEQASQSFFYNDFGQSFDARQADWLFLHEATPGHHYQLVGAGVAPKCKSQLPTRMFPAFSEGWAAYVEDMGEDLGLYQKPEERLAAVEWNMVRSVRVSLDVALNIYDWSDEQALEYWRKNVRGQRDIAQREIDRMRRWPAQVITYKYGASVFQRINKHIKASPAGAERLKKFHGAVIRYGNMPVTVFENLLPEMLEAQAQ